MLPPSPHPRPVLVALPSDLLCRRAVDNVYMGRGSDRLHTVWIPWARTPVELGGLVVLESSNSLPGFARMRNTCPLPSPPSGHHAHNR